MRCSKILSKIPNGSIEVLQILREEEQLTIDEIDQLLPHTDLSTLRYAIRRLLEVKIIRSIPDLLDMRTVKYTINSDPKLREVFLELPIPIVDQLRESFKNLLGEGVT